MLAKLYALVTPIAMGAVLLIGLAGLLLAALWAADKALTSLLKTTRRWPALVRWLWVTRAGRLPWKLVKPKKIQKPSSEEAP